MTKNIPLLYGFSFFDQFMIVIASWVPYLATQGIGMRQFMELRAVFAIVILSGEAPSGLLSDLWGRKKTLLLGSTLQGRQFFPPPDVALLYDSYLAADGEKSRGAGLLGNAKLAAQTGTA